LAKIQNFLLATFLHPFANWKLCPDLFSLNELDIEDTGEWPKSHFATNLSDGAELSIFVWTDEDGEEHRDAEIHFADGLSFEFFESNETAPGSMTRSMLSIYFDKITVDEWSATLLSRDARTVIANVAERCRSSVVKIA